MPRSGRSMACVRYGRRSMLFWLAPMAYHVGEGEDSIGGGFGAVAEGFHGVGQLVTAEVVSLCPLSPVVESVKAALGCVESFGLVVPAVPHVLGAEGVASSG